jgi:ATP-dependent Lhr-like helicase
VPPAASPSASPTTSSERLGEGVGRRPPRRLSKRTRLSARPGCKTGELSAVVATASLELGIDVGEVELVIQIGSPRAIAVLRQRVGRALSQRRRRPRRAA